MAEMIPLNLIRLVPAEGAFTEFVDLVCCCCRNTLFIYKLPKHIAISDMLFLYNIIKGRDLT